MSKRSQIGVTLIELMISLVIVATLATIAIPSYSKYRLRVTRVAGKDCLVSVQQRMETYFTRHNLYTTTLTNLGYASPYSCDGDDLYRLSITAADTNCPLTSCYVVIAAARGKQAEDGNLRLTYKADEVDPNTRVVQERYVDGSWSSGWD